MDEDLQAFEAELKRLRPLAPSPETTTRIECALGRAAAPARPLPAPLHWVWFAALPAAAALALLLSRPGARRPAPERPPAVPPAAAASGDQLKPVAAENVLYAARDEGVVVLDDGTPARRERLQFVDTITWRNPRTNASLRWTVPREEIRVVPISFQ